jgi:hypothetical protein
MLMTYFAEISTDSESVIENTINNCTHISSLQSDLLPTISILPPGDRNER